MALEGLSEHAARIRAELGQFEHHGCRNCSQCDLIVVWFGHDGLQVRCLFQLQAGRRE